MVENLKDFEKYIRDLIKASDPVEAELLDAALEAYLAGIDGKDFPLGKYQEEYELLEGDPEYATYKRLKDKFKPKRR